MGNIKSLICLIAVFLLSITEMSAYIIEPFAYEQNGRWGYCYNGAEMILPMYDNVVDLSLLPVFLAEKDSLWSLRRADNSAITPFVFEDVNLREGHLSHRQFMAFDSICMYDNGTILPADRFERDEKYLLPQSISILGVIPVKKGGKWGFIDLSGETLLPFEYDMAYRFMKWLYTDDKRNMWMAEVRKDGKSAWIDLFGNVIIPWQESKGFSTKELKKYLKKLNNKERKKYDDRISYIHSKTNAAATTTEYTPVFTGEITVAEVKAVQKAAPRKNTKSKSSRKQTKRVAQPIAAKPKYMLLYADGTPVVSDTLDMVFPREGDAVRVKRDGKMRVINLATGRYMFGRYDSISPFDKQGMSVIFTGDRRYIIGLNNNWTDPNDSFKKLHNEISEALNNEKWHEAGTKAEVLAGILPYTSSPWYRRACNQLIARAVNNYNYYCDPVKIAQREKEAAEKAAKEKESSGSGWALLGDILDLAGSFSNSETSKGVKELGKTIKSVAEPTTQHEPSTSSVSTETNEEAIEETRAEKSVEFMEAQISSIDLELQEISQQQAELAKERIKAKNDVVIAGQTAVKAPRGANAVRNNSPSKTRQQAKQRAAAQVKPNNRLSSIDTRLDQLKDRRDALILRRNRLKQQIAEASGETTSSSYSTENGGKGKRSQQFWENLYSQAERTAKSIYDSLTATGYKTKKDGQETGGSAAGGRGIVNFSGMTHELRKAQRHMRDVRNDARKDGFTIAQSKYETITVSYN